MTDWIDPVLNLLLYTQLVLTLFIAAGFAGPLKKQSPVNGVCAAFFFVYALVLFDRLYVALRWYEQAPHLTEVFTSFELLFPALFYLIVVASTRAQHISGSLYLRHAMPFLAGLVLRIPIFGLQGSDKIIWESGDLVAHDQLASWHVTLVGIADELIDLLYLLCLTLYLVQSLIRLRAHRSNLLDLHSDTQGRTLLWLYGFVGLFTGLWVLLALVFDASELSRSGALLLGVAELLVIVGLAYCSLLQAPVYTASEASVLSELVVGKSTKYAKSALSAVDADRIAEELAQSMEHQQLYLDPGLTLPALAKQLGVSTNHLSQVINARHDSRFHDYVNRHRVGAAAQQLDQNPDTTVLDIAMACGFNSKSTFNAAFKKVFGTTPTQYRNRKR